MMPMKLRLVAVVLCLARAAATSASSNAPLLLHQQAPFPLSELPVLPASSSDRIFASAQTSNGVAVVDPFAAELEGVVSLGGKLPETLGALYRGQNIVHGAGFSPDRRTVAAICPGSDTVVFLDAGSYEVKQIVETRGRAPHEATFSPSGDEVWVAVRGSNFVEVLDASSSSSSSPSSSPSGNVDYDLKTLVEVPDGPGMVAFSPDGSLAFVCSSFTPEAVVVDAVTKKTVARIPQNSTFCPNLAVTPDGEQLWLTLKDSGKTQVVEAKEPFRTIAVVDTGAITNHVNFAVPPTSTANGTDSKPKTIAFVSVGGEGKVLAFSADGVRFGGPAPKLLKEIEMPRGGAGEPHALWPSGDGARMWVGLQVANAVVAVDATTLEVVPESWVDLGAQSPMGMVYVPGAAAAAAGANANANANAKTKGAKRTGATAAAKNASSSYVGKFLSPEEARAQSKAFHFELVSAAGNNKKNNNKGNSNDDKENHKKKVLTSLVVNSQSVFVDALEAVVAGLAPGERYALCLGSSDGENRCEFVVANFAGGKDGAASVASVGPFQDLLFSKSGPKEQQQKQKRFFSVVPRGEGEEGKGGGKGGRLGAPVQVQRQKEK